MNTLQAEARTNLELILAEVDVLCKGIRLPKKKSRRGRKPKYSDKFIFLAVNHGFSRGGMPDGDILV